MNTINNEFDYATHSKRISNLIVEAKQSIKQKPKKKYDTENDFPIFKYIEILEDLLKIETKEDFEKHKEDAINRFGVGGTEFQ